MRRSETQFVEALGIAAAHRAQKFRKASGLRQGIGDDCAVSAWPGKNDLLVTTDLFLEDVHFRRRWMEPRAVGHKTLARGLSDIAAMGGIPRLAFLSIGIPDDLDRRWIDKFLSGFLKLAEKHRVVLAGGDTGRSEKGFVADIVVVGEVPRGRAVLRSGARVGDEIWVTGKLGNAAAGLDLLERPKRGAGRKTANAKAVDAFLYPEPRIAVGQFLRNRKTASAMMDISDGLSIDLDRLCKASGVGAVLNAEWIPMTESGKRTTLHHALHGGEDFELLFTAPPSRARSIPRRIGGVELTRIGTIMPRKRGASNLMLERDGRSERLPILGWQHF